MSERDDASALAEGQQRRVEQLARTMGAGGVQAIAAERSRQQIELGHTLDYDQRHSHGELLAAAVCYLNVATAINEDRLDGPTLVLLDEHWPWPNHPLTEPADADPFELLAKAGALIAAEIDRHAYAEALRAARPT